MDIQIKNLARHGKTWLGRARQGVFRHDVVMRGVVRSGKVF